MEGSEYSSGFNPLAMLADFASEYAHFMFQSVFFGEILNPLIEEGISAETLSDITDYAPHEIEDVVDIARQFLPYFHLDEKIKLILEPIGITYEMLNDTAHKIRAIYTDIRIYS
jgi:hypothetical protein